MSYHPNLSPELNALIARTQNLANTVDMRAVKPGQVVKVVFYEDGGQEVELTFAVVRPASPGTFSGGEHFLGRLMSLSLRDQDRRYFLKHGGGEPKPGHEVRITGGCSWNPGAPFGCSMIHMQHIDRDRWLYWHVGPMDVLLNVPVKSVFVYTPDKGFQLPAETKWDYQPPTSEEAVPEERLREFYVRTTTSVYHIRESYDESLFSPVVQKMGLKGKSELQVGEKVSNFKYVGVTGEQLVFYNSPIREPAEDVEPRFMAGWTSNLVALFIDKEEALSSLEAENCTKWDDRWLEQTKAVLKAIGDDHPCFIISSKFPVDYH